MNSHLPKPGPRGRQADGSPHPIDIHVGNRVRLRRVLLGMSQEDLASRLGITFQQVQKYERGLNRISGSRLYDISKILQVNIDYFFDEFQTEHKEMPFDENTPLSNLMQQEEALVLVNAYNKIKKPHLRQMLFDLVVSMSNYSNDTQD